MACPTQARQCMFCHLPAVTLPHVEYPQCQTCLDEMAEDQEALTDEEWDDYREACEEQ